MKRHLLLACLLPALALCACGSDDGTATAEIEAVVHTAATVHFSARCPQIATPRFLEQVSGEKGAAALRTCEEEAEDPSGKAKSVAVSNVSVDGGQASADVSFHGLPVLDHETVVVSLVDGGMGWRLDGLHGFAPGGKPRSPHLAGTSRLSARDKRCADRVTAEAPAREREERLAATGFSSSRYAVASNACLGSGASEVSPPGAAFAFKVPGGFHAAPAVKDHEGFQVQLSAPATRHFGAGIDVYERRLSADLGSLDDPGRFRVVQQGFQDGLEEEERKIHATESIVEAVRIDGFKALRWVIANGHPKPFPGTDTEATVLFDTSGRQSVWIDCTWGRDQAESVLVQNGCQAVIRSLRFG